MDINNSLSRDLKIVFPNGGIHHIKTQYVQVTKHGKYVLNYLEKKNDTYIPSFTEINNIGNGWYKNPFHNDYEEYDFEEFNKELSDKIIQELPEELKLRIRINDDRKVVNKIDDTEIKEITKEESNNKNETDLFMFLVPNDGDELINKNDDYPYSFPFPVFSIGGKQNHNTVNYDDDINNGLDFEEIEFSRFGLSLNNRNNVSEFLKNQKEILKINDLSTMELSSENPNEINRLHFVLCPNIDTFNELYKAKSLYVDCNVDKDIEVKELLSKALKNEIAFYYETESGSKDNNGVKHNNITK